MKTNKLATAFFNLNLFGRFSLCFLMAMVLSATVMFTAQAIFLVILGLCVSGVVALFRLLEEIFDGPE